MIIHRSKWLWASGELWQKYTLPSHHHRRMNGEGPCVQRKLLLLRKVRSLPLKANPPH